MSDDDSTGNGIIWDDDAGHDGDFVFDDLNDQIQDGPKHQFTQHFSTVAGGRLVNFCELPGLLSCAEYAKVRRTVL